MTVYVPYLLEVRTMTVFPATSYPIVCNFTPANIAKLTNQKSHALTPSKHSVKFRGWRICSSLNLESISVTGNEETSTKNEKFDWYSQWYPIMPECDLDKKVPHSKKVLGLDLVLWWDRNEGAGAWKVFDDRCPHRMAPLSQGRIDQWGRLQCVYHGWCFNGTGNCKFIPQAPSDGPPVNDSKRACVGVYPSLLRYGVVWFWPDTEVCYEEAVCKKEPPFIEQLEDPTMKLVAGNRDMAYSYDVLIENLMDPAHVRYAHYRILPVSKNKEPRDREGGSPMELVVKMLNKDGYLAEVKGPVKHRYVAPCMFYSYTDSSTGESNLAQKFVMMFLCVPLSPGKSRVIWVFRRFLPDWIENIFPRWLRHVGQNLILDSDMYLVYEQEKKLRALGPENWGKLCYTPTKSDALVVGFRTWFRRFAGNEVDWRGKYSGDLPPMPAREQLLDRYWTHTVNCESCRKAYKWLNVAEIVLQIASVGIIAFAKSSGAAYRWVAFAVACFAASRWLNHFIYKNFRYHDYFHGYR